MNVTVFRIDERLIHGQIVTAWMQYADAAQILVVDDAAATDNFRQTLLRMATPKGIDLKILTIAEAKKLLAEDQSNTKTLLLMGNPAGAVQLVDDIENLPSINVGNQNMKKEKIRILDNFWLFEEDIEAFQQLEAKGITCEFRTVPNDHSQNVYELIKKVNG